MSEDNTNKEEVSDPSLAEPVSGDGRGGKRPGAGRPKGSKNNFSKHSVERLEELGFDPMEKMVELYKETTTMVTEMEDANHPRRYSAQALATLMITKQKLINDLLRYGYRPVPEKQEQEITEKKPMSITLTGLAPVAAPLTGEVKPEKDSDEIH